jgi:hypothetical protein
LESPSEDSDNEGGVWGMTGGKDRRRSPVSKQYPLKRGEIISDVRKRAGCSSAGRWSKKDSNMWCGHAAGANCEYTWPVGDIQHARNALSRAHFAPNPDGVRRCACAAAKRLGVDHWKTCKNLPKSSSRPLPHTTHSPRRSPRRSRN